MAGTNVHKKDYRKTIYSTKGTCPKEDRYMSQRGHVGFLVSVGKIGRVGRIDRVIGRVV